MFRIRTALVFSPQKFRNQLRHLPASLLHLRGSGCGFPIEVVDMQTTLQHNLLYNVSIGAAHSIRILGFFGSVKS